MTEIWAPIAGFVGSYEVSTIGRVRSLDRVIRDSAGRNCFRKGRVLKPSRAGAPGKDYPSVALGKGNHRTIHRLVLETFVGPCPDGTEACHNNGDRFDNRLDNLRWDTPSNNNRDKRSHGTDHMAQRTHCNRGHAFTPENTVLREGGGRRCRTCRNDDARDKVRRKLSTTEGRSNAAAYQREWRRRAGKVSGQHNFGSRTHCNNGHEFTPENTYLRPNGGRRCRTCQAARRAEANRKALEKRRADPAKRAAHNAYMREYRARSRNP
ncbi:NUMOD4 motif-containing HNH endonuclease [Mycobacterium sp. PSTR-4-N]|uniref:NUMOD4 motif-containing HNH endonuclease n=1 Tax=Mycobacterium sp. PSTR-4-N TaxID=2917745 RepID=UPI001F1525BF|nr:NUMOD4 motif-containing HNH endonuclease [Mycobacterium sp. PSTR-4-N]MCG7596363.1 NUMOD4 motif-containing HNH endonuclease [Mycobacterium sp. PSTR-4-N]